MPDQQPGRRVIPDVERPAPSSYQRLLELPTGQVAEAQARYGAMDIPASEDATLRALGYDV